jgi:hypothetical protein
MGFQFGRLHLHGDGGEIGSCGMRRFVFATGGKEENREEAFHGGSE